MSGFGYLKKPNLLSLVRPKKTDSYKYPGSQASMKNTSFLKFDKFILGAS